jgi:hypothetical protein
MKNEEENLRVHELNIYSHRESVLCTRRFQEVEELKSKIEEMKVSRSRRLKKSKIEEVKDLKFQTQPESTTRIESRGLLTRVCPSGTRGLVYRARPIKEVDKYKDSTS